MNIVIIFAEFGDIFYNRACPKPNLPVISSSYHYQGNYYEFEILLVLFLRKALLSDLCLKYIKFADMLMDIAHYSKFYKMHKEHILKI